MEGPSEQSKPIDRRPLAARSRPLWIAVAHWLGGRGVSPNLISVMGVVFGVGAGVLLWATARVEGIGWRVAWVGAAAGCALRLACNLLDGMVAVERGKASAVGELYNEIPDRVSDIAVLAGLGYAAGSKPELGWAAAAMAVFVAYVRAAVKVAGAPQDYRGPMAKQQRMVVVIVASLYMGLAPESWGPTLARDGWSVPVAALWVVIVGCGVTIARRLVRASSMLRGR